MSKLGLVMTGGGARGAYQAGVLKRIGEIKTYKDKRGPFDIIGAASAGAVNAAALAYGSHDFSKCTLWLSRMWGKLTIQDIYRTDLGSIVPKASQWIKDLSFGAIIGSGSAQSLLDASPLNDFLSARLKGDRIESNISKGHLDALAIVATNYNSGKAFVFVQGAEKEKLWVKRRQIAIHTKITVDHICASAAIPIVFAPVKLTTEYGTNYFGDGCLRLTTPLSPVIRLKAKKLLAIGVRSQNPTDRIPEANKPPSLSQILGTALNAIFLDHLDTDIDHLERLNTIISKIPNSQKEIAKMEGGIQQMKVLAISPSEDLGKIAEDFAHRLPNAVRYLMAGLGSMSSASDLMSYLLFDSTYTKTLVDIGYNDADARIAEIESLFLD
jgi:NTE family protein